MTFISGIPTTRISDAFIANRLKVQIQSDQIELFRSQNSISSGRRFALPSEDATSSLRAISLQRLIERKQQTTANVTTNQTYLTASEASISEISTLLSEVRGNAVSAIGSTVSPTQRKAIALEIESSLTHLLNSSNQRFRGRYLFSGTKTDTLPFQKRGDFVQYDGDEGALQALGDIAVFFESNVTGHQTFGAVSNEVLGNADLNPVLTDSTQLDSLRNGLGIRKGSIQVNVGLVKSIIDISPAHTIGDVARLIEANPPTGSVITARVTPTGLEITADSGDLTIFEVGSGTTASELGILNKLNTGPGPIAGADLNPIITNTTPLADILGTRAVAYVSPGGTNNDLVIEAVANGVDFNGATVNFVGQAALGNNALASYDEVTNVLTVTVDNAGQTAAQRVVDAINLEGTFRARADLSETNNKLSGPIRDTLTDPLATGTFSGGSGKNFDAASGLRIENLGQVFTLDFATAQTIGDVLNVINSSPAGVIATINASATGIDLRSRVSGSTFSVGENGGTTAAELGVRSFHGGTALSSLNLGDGVRTVAGNDFTIQRTDGVTFDVDVTTATTVQDVLDLINTNATNLGGGIPVVVRLATVGNGIELVHDDPAGVQPLQVTFANASQAALDLGLIPLGSSQSNPATTPALATAALTLPGLNNDLTFSSVATGEAVNGTRIRFTDSGLGPGGEVLTHDAVNKILTFDIDAATTSANDIIALLAAHPTAGPLVTAALVPADGAPNDGSGLIDLTATAILQGGKAATVTGSDTNPLEVRGLFTALIRLKQALEINDTAGIERAVEILDESTVDLNFTRAELGIRQETLDVLHNRLLDEDAELQGALSLEIDVDLAAAVTDVVARQASLEASLRAAGLVTRLSLIDFL